MSGLRLFDIFRKKDLDCGDVRAASSDFIDGDVGGRERARIAFHLERCGPCRSFINTLRATVNLLRSTPASEPPEGFKQRIRDSLGDRGA